MALPFPAGAPGQPVAAVQPQPGLGFTNMAGPEDQCHCCPEGACGCCGNPVYYTTVDRSYQSSKCEQKYGCSMAAFSIQNAPILNGNVSMEMKLPCCPCGDTVVDVMDNGTPIGQVRGNRPCCLCCEDKIVEEAFDARGQSRFARKMNCCTRYDLVGSFGCCGFYEFGVPIWGPGGQQVVGNMSMRKHACCPANYPSWTGFRFWPVSVQSREDQILLLAMAHSFEFQVRRSHNRKNQGAGAAAAMS